MNYRQLKTISRHAFWLRLFLVVALAKVFVYLPEMDEEISGPLLAWNVLFVGFLLYFQWETCAMRSRTVGWSRHTAWIGFIPIICIGYYLALTVKRNKLPKKSEYGDTSYLRDHEVIPVSFYYFCLISAVLLGLLIDYHIV